MNKGIKNSTRNMRYLLPIALILLLGACRSEPTTTAAPEATMDHATDHGPEVVLTADQVKAIGLVTGTMEQRGLKSSLKANGHLALPCLLYTSDAADERSRVALGGRRIIKTKKQNIKQKEQ